MIINTKPVIKPAGVSHFRRVFSKDAFSHRITLVGRDQVETNTTLFEAAAGVIFNDIQGTRNENVFVYSGRIRVTYEGGAEELGPMGSYYLGAGTVCNLEILEDAMLFCVFSQAQGGPMPENEPDPEPKA
ncbi:MAG: hypothetical protein EXS51_02720 [Candidatus Taylorbacteria bacterium]|nr:hypothetical protein [Candidatus Taylorbacteria bacterium]